MERKTLWVCERCLAAIISREGNQAILPHDIALEFDEDNVEATKCDWCEQDGFDRLYELIQEECKC